MSAADARAKSAGPPGNRRPHEPVRIGIAGVGNWGRLHLETLAGLHGVHLAAICDPDADRRAGAVDAARRIGAGRAAASAPDDARAFDSFEACLCEADLDGIVIATKDEQHTPHAVAALERGWHVFVEKPLAISLRDARAVHEAAARAGRVAMVGTILRFSVPHRQLADAVHLDRLGGLLHVRCVRYVTTGWLARTPVHTALRLSVHDIDLVIWLSRARVTRVAAAGHTLPGEGRPRSLVALLRMNSGASAVVETHYVLPPAFPSNTLPPEAPGSRVGVIEAFGTEGMGRLDDLGGPSLWNRDGVYSPDVFVTPRTGERIGGAMRAELEHFVSCAATGTPSDLAPLGDSVHATAVAEAIIRAEQSGAVEQVEETP